MGEPYLFGAEGWHLVPGHFAERHGLIVIIALGESIVAIGVGAGSPLTWGIAGAAVLGIAVVAAMWWTYFDIVALVSARRLARAPEGKVRNELARDSYSYIHFLLVAGIILFALGLKKTIGHPTIRSKTCRLSLWSEASPSICSAWSPSATGTCTRSTGTGSAWPLLLFALFPAATEVSALGRCSRVLNVLLWSDDRRRDPGLRRGPRQGPPWGRSAPGGQSPI